MLLKKNGTYYKPHLNSVTLAGLGYKNKRQSRYLPSPEFHGSFKSDCYL